jgi:TBC1 domain family member 20
MQGLHEIAMTLMLQVGEGLAYCVLKRLVCTQLRDNTRVCLQAVTDSLQLIHPILAGKDLQLAAHLRRKQLPPYFALSWVITWFSHNISAALVPRLFDLFLASHPLMPLYLYLFAVLQARACLHACLPAFYCSPSAVSDPCSLQVSKCAGSS